MKVIGQTVEVAVGGTGVLVGPPGVTVGTAVFVRVGVLDGAVVADGPPGVWVGSGVLVGVFVGGTVVLVRVGVLVETVVDVLVGGTGVVVRVAVAACVVAVAVLHAGSEKVSICPADNPPVLHSYWV